VYEDAEAEMREGREVGKGGGGGEGRERDREEDLGGKRSMRARARTVETGAGDQGAPLGIESTADARKGKKTQGTRRRRRRRRRRGRRGRRREERGTRRNDPRPPPREGEAGGGRGGTRATHNRQRGTKATRGPQNNSAGPRRARVITVSVPSGADVLQTGGESSPPPHPSPLVPHTFDSRGCLAQLGRL